MTRSWTIPHDVTRQLMSDPAVERYLAGDIGNQQDPRMRAAEMFDLVRHLEARTGQTYHSANQMDEDLYASAAGGGFGIPTILRDIVAGIIADPPSSGPTTTAPEPIPPAPTS